MTITGKLTALNAAIDGLTAKIATTDGKLDALIAELDGGTTPPPVVPPVTPPPELKWDARLDTLNVKVERVAGARYQLIAAFCTQNGSWESAPPWTNEWVATATGGGGDHMMFAGVFNLDGTPLSNKKVLFTWPDGLQELATDDAGWCNGICQAVYYPEQGQTGPYAISPLKGDKLIGGGLPVGNHWSIFGVFKANS
jgi:hypothetical protein